MADGEVCTAREAPSSLADYLLDPVWRYNLTEMRASFVLELLREDHFLFLRFSVSIAVCEMEDVGEEPIGRMCLKIMQCISREWVKCKNPNPMGG